MRRLEQYESAALKVNDMITRIVIEKREPFAAGYEFGITGAYEKLVGKATARTPSDPPNRLGT